MTKFTISLAPCFLMTLTIGGPQEDPRQARFDKIMEDSALVSLSMRTDREDCLPGEAATISIVARNNTNETLEILKPFSDLNYFIPYQIGPTGKRIALMPDPSVSALPPEFTAPPPNFNIKTIKLAPGQEDIQKVDSFEGATLWGGEQVQEDPGDYEIEYSYGMSGKNVTAIYRVVPARLGAASLAVKMPRNTTYLPNGKKSERAETLYTYRQAFELISGTTTYLCVNPMDMGVISEIKSLKEASLGIGDRKFVFIRVAESQTGFKDLTFAVRPNEDLVLTWKDAQQQLQTLTLDKNALKK